MTDLKKNVHIFIQARLSSTRLPGKVLLPINKIPIIKICYDRVVKGFSNTLVLTSDESSDDKLAEALVTNKINYRRGSLKNVLSRFFDSATHLGNEDIIIRLTADNIFPDVSFLNDLLHFYIDNDCEYLTTVKEESGLPYGLSAEVFKKKHLSMAFKNAKNPNELEHVTPWIINNYKNTNFISQHFQENLSNLRCTIDTPEDYEKMCQLVKGVDIINIDSYELCKLLKVSKNE